jgi:hypothetical protein
VGQGQAFQSYSFAIKKDKNQAQSLRYAAQHRTMLKGGWIHGFFGGHPCSRELPCLFMLHSSNSFMHRNVCVCIKPLQHLEGMDYHWFSLLLICSSNQTLDLLAGVCTACMCSLAARHTQVSREHLFEKHCGRCLCV